jgi:hypothetical protein
VLESETLRYLDSLFDEIDGPVVVAMTRVRVMKVTIDEVVNMIAVRDGLVSAAWPVCMGRIMP